jgi:glucose-6-phosphate 1-dehydrogenase
MEPPAAFDAISVRDEKVKVLRAIRRFTPADVAESTVRGQYRRCFVLGEEVPGYREEPSVPKTSRTETYAALRLQIDNWRWADVPFFIRTGKRLPRQVTEIRVRFKPPRHSMFAKSSLRAMHPNAITIRIQPEEGISLRFAAKLPAAGMKIGSVNMDFLYATSFLVDAPDAYERLLLDCMVGDPTLFTRADEVETAWALIDPVERSWAAGNPRLTNYDAGTWGPAAADKLMSGGRTWHRP